MKVTLQIIKNCSLLQKFLNQFQKYAAEIYVRLPYLQYNKKKYFIHHVHEPRALHFCHIKVSMGHDF